MKYYLVAIVGLHLKPLTYFSKENLYVGEIVNVYLKSSKQIAVVIDEIIEQPEVKNIKQITKLAKPIYVGVNMLKLANWMSGYYLSPISEVFGIMLPSGDFGAEEQCNSFTNTPIELSEDFEFSMPNSATDTQKKLLRWFLDNKHYVNTISSCKDAGYRLNTIKKCLKENWLIEQKNKVFKKSIILNKEQDAAKKTILANSGFQVFLLDGVTGSGKTEVYCEVINDVLAKKQQVLILVPEIGLTQQLVDRIVKRCGTPALVIHSQISASARNARWHAANSGECQLVIGTRSALFTPLNNLGLIIIDEGHDPSFKQQNICCYSARHVAIMLAKSFHIPVILGSATPSIESLHNCNIGLYKRLRLTQNNFMTQQPSIEIYDLCGKATEQGVAKALKQNIAEVLKQKEQVLVFVNRRGYAPAVICHNCAYCNKCESCDTNFVFHSFNNQLICHYCSKTRSVPERCLECGAKSWVHTGIGTQRVENLLKSWFPDKSILRIDRDIVKTNFQFSEALMSINTNSVDIIIGTQMLAKGHDFSNIGLVAILDVDSGLFNPDFRSFERLAQLMVQVAGRSGRRSKPGRIWLQTHQKQHTLFSVLYNGYESWANLELCLRKKHSLEPFMYSIHIHIQSHKIQVLDKIKQDFAGSIKILPEVSVVGPIANLKPKRKGYWRFMILIESKKRSLLNKQASIIRDASYLKGWQSHAKWSFDVDPISQHF